MEIAIGCLTLIVLGLLAVLYAQNRAHAEERAQTAVERRELLTRIQRPQYAPITASDFVAPEQPPDEFDRVGEIERDPELLTRDG